MAYYNSTTEKWYNEGDSMTFYIDEHTLFSGVPTAEQLIEWGYELYEDPVVEPTLEEMIAAKIQDVYRYDNSEEVNSFSVNGVNAWFDKETRSNFRGSLSDAELLGETEVSVPIKGTIYTIPIQTAKMFLAQIQRYADACTIVSAEHVNQVQQCSTKREVEEFDITAGYPEKLVFNIPTNE